MNRKKVILFSVFVIMALSLLMMPVIGKTNSYEEIKLEPSLILYRTIDEMYYEADLVIEGTIKDAHYKNVYVLDSIPLTFSKVNVKKVYKDVFGNVQDEIILVETGGIFGNTKISIKNDELVNNNDHFILFLNKDNGTLSRTEESFAPLGGFQGKLKINKKILSEINELITKKSKTS